MTNLTHAISPPDWLKSELMEYRSRAAHGWGRTKGVAAPVDLDLLFVQSFRPAAGAHDAHKMGESEAAATAMSAERAEAAAAMIASIANEARPYDDMVLDSSAKQSDKIQQKATDVDMRATKVNATLLALHPPGSTVTLPASTAELLPSLARII